MLTPVAVAMPETTPLLIADEVGSKVDDMVVLEAVEL